MMYSRAQVDVNDTEKFFSLSHAPAASYDMQKPFHHLDLFSGIGGNSYAADQIWGGVRGPPYIR